MFTFIRNHSSNKFIYKFLWVNKTPSIFPFNLFYAFHLLYILLCLLI